MLSVLLPRPLWTGNKALRSYHGNITTPYIAITDASLWLLISYYLFFSARPLFNLGVGEKESLQILSFGLLARSKVLQKYFSKHFLSKYLFSREKSESCLNPTTASSCLSHHSRSLSQFTHTFTPTHTHSHGHTHTLSLNHTSGQYSDYTHAFSPAHARHALLHPPTLF